MIPAGSHDADPRSDDAPADRPDAADCSALLRALGNETRLGIVRLLFDGPRFVYEIQAALEVESTLLSQHLRVLRELEVVEFQRVGKGLRYSITPEYHAQADGRAMDFGCCRLVFPDEAPSQEPDDTSR